MEKYNNLKKSTQIGLYISMALMVFCFVTRVISLIRLSSADRPGAIIHTVVSLIIAILIIAYSFWGYKKPHGNMLKYTMFIFGISLLIHTQFGRQKAVTGFNYFTLASGIAAMLIAYICGRLHRIKRNKIIMIIVGVILVVIAVNRIINTSSQTFLRNTTPISNFVYWVTLCFAYTARYEEHKEAGLMDKAEK